ncbi:hypothetical protein GYMLUDRAFT_250355 [Collybiopsis luxurians FD-317 M1]|uniref:Uncharacterized protein n=1 Tax=Collybiopsis luxurians FD-317 M1 TaxID=944289 RepID=A0A0D0C6T7_9AGAR|nr:hypothetical protein GYMLUDRAFT_250355 [Collybiopsis luxurians FD-317 M1]
MTGLQNMPYYQGYPEELGLVSEMPKPQQVMRKAGEPSPVILGSSQKGKEVVWDTVDADVEMEAPEELNTMNLDYPEEVPPPPALILTPPAPVWKAIDNQSYCEQIPSNGSSLAQDELIQTAIKHIVMQIAALVSGPGKIMLEQDLWALADGILQGAFNNLKEQLNHSSSQPPALFSNDSLIQFESLSLINMTSANIIDSQQDKLLQAYWEFQALT